ncbi:MAG TPA: site-specific integrase [Stellaceae bacterium]|nr:site-specific integrase [Stellaceae bacterium]
MPRCCRPTYLREVISPPRAILRHAADLGWYEAPRLKSPKIGAARTLCLLPEEAEGLVEAAAPHLRPLLLFCSAPARMAEAVYLEWRDVDLVGARAIFWKTKNGTRRNAALPPRTVAALASLPHRTGVVFLSPRGPYGDRRGAYGGQIKKGRYGALARAGLDRELAPYDLRHTWASWYYAVHRDLLALKVEGGWSSVALVERYAHLLPQGHEAAIGRFLGHQAGTRSGGAASKCLISPTNCREARILHTGGVTG